MDGGTPGTLDQPCCRLVGTAGQDNAGGEGAKGVGAVLTLSPGMVMMGRPAHSASPAVWCALYAGVSRNRSQRPCVRGSGAASAAGRTMFSQGAERHAP